MYRRRISKSLAMLAATVVIAAVAAAPSAQLALPTAPLAMRAFTLRFDPAGTFSLEGPEWPSMSGTWTTSGNAVTFDFQSGPPGCAEPGRYTYAIEGARVSFAVETDTCQPRRMILDRSQWMPPGTAPPPPARAIVRTAGPAKSALPRAAKPAGSWPSFRGAEASGSADGQDLPDRWSPTTGESILWRTAIPGLAHSSPIVWGDLVFLTTAISSRGNATFKPGLYGDGTASEDRSSHRWVLYAIDKQTGRIRWTRTAAEDEPRNRRHIKSTYASASPATDGRIVVAWFGSQGLFAYDVDGGLRWSVDLGRVDMGAYDIPPTSGAPRAHPSSGTTS